MARLNGCDGYIAQVWTGTARTPNVYRGQLRERTFETAFLEYGTMQNLVRATGRRVWYLNDPVEDNPRHDWEDYRRNWESTLVASLFQPEVWHFEVMPWPERVFGGRYPSRADPQRREPMPPAYATEVQTVINTLNDLHQQPVRWDAGADGVGVLVSDSLMFERGEPQASDPHLSHIYGLALPLLKRGVAVTPVQLENVGMAGYLAPFRLLLLTYQGMKPLEPAVHDGVARWVRAGGTLVVWDDDSDPYNQVHDWWNSGRFHYATPRQHLFAQLGLETNSPPGRYRVGHGTVWFHQQNPAQLAADPQGDTVVAAAVRQAAERAGLTWRETNYLLLRRGNYVVAAGLDESLLAPPKTLQGHFVNLLDPALNLRTEVTLNPGTRWFLLDVDRTKRGRAQILAAACKTVATPGSAAAFHCVVEAVAGTPAVVLLRSAKPPRAVSLANVAVQDFHYDTASGLLWIRFPNESHPRELVVSF